MTKKVNKMSVAIQLMRSIRANNPTSAPAQWNKLFKEQVKVHPDLLMSQQGANTYCSNVNVFLNGGDPYRHNKSANEKRRKLKEAGAEVGINYIDTSIGKLRAADGADTENRWWVINEQKHEIVETHSTRTLAQQIAKALGLVWKDKKLIVKAA